MWVSFVEIVIAVVVGSAQIYLAQKMKDIETRQDKREELRRQDDIYAEATRFIQKYNQNGYQSEILLLPLCVAAYKYNSVFPYHRDIYREFCSLTEDVQNEILRRQEIDLKCVKCENYYSVILSKILNNNKKRYPNDSDNRLFYDDAKYFHRALTLYGNKYIPSDLRCEIDIDEANARKSPIIMISGKQAKDMSFEAHITNLLAYHKNETPLSDLLPCFQDCDEIIAAYICCLIAKYTAIYNYNESEIETAKEENLGFVYDYNGQLYMEDLFLNTLHTVENYDAQERI